MNYLSTHQQENILHIKFKRHESHNAINLGVIDELEQTLFYLPKNVKVLLFEPETSSKQVSLSGGDLKEFHALKTEEEGREMAERMHNILFHLEESPYITIGIFSGNCFGGGCEMALAFDQRWISTETSFSFTQLAFGLPPGWGGFTRLAQLIRSHRALDVYLNQRSLDANELYRLGVAQRVIDPQNFDSVVTALSEKLARTPASAFNALLKASRAFKLNSKQQIRDELGPFAKAWASDQHHQLVDEFFQKKNTPS